MTHISTLTPRQYNYMYGPNGEFANQQTSIDIVNSILTQEQAAPEQSGSTDGADDGKIGFFSKVGSFFKGIGKTIGNAVKNIFTPKGLLKTAAIIGACCIPGIGPVIGMGLCAYGAVKGAGTVIKGAQAAANAKTDAEAKEAWENIGGGTFQVAASVAPMKGFNNAIKANGGYLASIKAGGNFIKGAATSAKSYVAANGIKGTLKNGASATKDGLSTLKSNAALKGKLLKDQYSVLRAGGNSRFAALKEMAKQTDLYHTYDVSRGFGNNAFRAAGDAVRNTKAYVAFDKTAMNVGYKSGLTAASPAVISLLEQANSEDQALSQEAISQLQALGYNIY